MVAEYQQLVEQRPNSGGVAAAIGRIVADSGRVRGEQQRWTEMEMPNYDRQQGMKMTTKDD